MRTNHRQFFYASALSGGSIATSGLPHANGESVRSAIDTIGKAGGVGDATILTMGREDVLRATIVDCRKFKNDAGLI